MVFYPANFKFMIPGNGKPSKMLKFKVESSVKAIELLHIDNSLALGHKDKSAKRRLGSCFEDCDRSINLIELTLESERSTVLIRFINSKREFYF